MVHTTASIASIPDSRNALCGATVGHSGIRAYFPHPLLGWILRPLSMDLAVEDHVSLSAPPDPPRIHPRASLCRSLSSRFLSRRSPEIRQSIFLFSFFVFDAHRIFTIDSASLEGTMASVSPSLSKSERKKASFQTNFEHLLVFTGKQTRIFDRLFGTCAERIETYGI